MRFLYDNVVAIQVAIVCSVFAWLYGGTISSVLLPTMPWLLAILLEVLLCFPQRHAGETTYEARARVWRRLRGDPLVWLTVGFVFMMIIPFFNKGLCPCCDYPWIAFEGQSDQPPVPFIPFCVNRAEHLSVVLWFVPALVAMLAVKHALLKRGKRVLLELIVWNGLALCAVGVLQSVTGAQGPLWSEPPEGRTVYFFSTFGYPNMAGDYFMTLFAISIGLWRWEAEAARKESIAKGVGSSGEGGHKAFWRRHLHAIPSVAFFYAALMTLSRAVIVLVLALGILMFIHTFVTILARLKRGQRVKVAILTLVGIVIISTVCFVFMSKGDRIREGHGSDRETVRPTLRDDLIREIETVDAQNTLDRLSGQCQYHAAVACRVWKDHPFFGCGGWGYKHLCVPKMTDEEFEALQTRGGANVHNDYLQFLAEHGAVGLLFFFMFIVMLLWPIGRVWKVLINAVRFLKPKEQPPKPVALFVLPAPVTFIVLSSLATMIHALGDCPFRSPAILTLFFVALAAIDGFLPRVKEQH